MANTSSPSPVRLPDTHTFIPAQPGQSRSPCPALNALANHNYLPRSGADISLFHLTSALMAVYHLSFPFALFLALVGVLGCGDPLRMTVSLGALAVHGRIEHDASLVHDDAPTSGSTDVPAAASSNSSSSSNGASGTAQPPKSETKSMPVFAPTTPSPTLLASFLDLARTHAGTQGPGLGLGELVRARVEREREQGQRLGLLHREIAIGEVALGWLVMRDVRGQEKGEKEKERAEKEGGDGGRGEGREAVIPVRWAREWFGEERLPEGWVRPVRSVGLMEAMRVARVVKRGIQVAGGW